MSQFKEILESIVAPPPLPDSPVPAVNIVIASDSIAMFEYFKDKQVTDSDKQFVFKSTNLGILSLTHNIASKTKFSATVEVANPTPKFINTILDADSTSFAFSYGLGKPNLLWAGPYVGKLVNVNYRIDPGGTDILTFEFVPGPLALIDNPKSPKGDSVASNSAKSGTNEDSTKVGLAAAIQGVWVSTLASVTKSISAAPKQKEKESEQSEVPDNTPSESSSKEEGPPPLASEADTPSEPSRAEIEEALEDTQPEFVPELTKGPITWWKRFYFLKKEQRWVEIDNSYGYTLDEYLHLLYAKYLSNKQIYNFFWNNEEIKEIEQLAGSIGEVKLQGNDFPIDRFLAIKKFLSTCKLNLVTETHKEQGVTVVEMYIEMDHDYEKSTSYENWFDQISTAISQHRGDKFQYKLKLESNQHLIAGWYLEQGYVPSDKDPDGPILFVGSPEWIRELEGKEEEE